MRRSGFLAAALTLALSITPAPVATALDDRPPVAAFDTDLAPSAEIHIAPTGSDARGDGSPDRPFATLAFAASRATPGTAIRLHPGNYTGGATLEDLAGRPNAPIWIGGVDGLERPIIEGGGSGIHLVRAKYLVIHDLEIRGAAGNGLNADDGGHRDDPEASHHLVFRNLRIRDVGGDGNQDGLKLSGVRDFWVLDCEFTRCGGSGSGSGIDMVGCHRGLIAGCFLHALAGNAVQCKGGTADVEIRWCRISDPGARGVNIGGSTGLQYFRPPLRTDAPNAEARNIRVLCNVFEGGQTAMAFAGAVDCLVAQNTIINPGKWVLRILQETRPEGGPEFELCGRNTFESNLVWFARRGDPGVRPRVEVNIGPGTCPETFRFARNLWYAWDDPTHSAPTLPSPETDAVVGLDPGFFDVAEAEYRLRADSPAASRGRAHTPSDFRGTPWPDHPAIGAFQP